MKRNLTLLVSMLLLVAMVFTFAACKKHEHEFSADWSYDETNHWHKAACEEGDECASATSDLAAHTIVDGACSVCGYKADASAPECTDHAYSIEVTKEATCTEAGEKALTCTVCGYATTEEIAPLGHDEKTIAGKAPTCTEEGLSQGKECNVCGEILTAQTVIPKLTHEFVDGVCSACGVADPDYNGPKKHEWNFGLVDAGEEPADKTYIEPGTTYDDGYFTIVGEVYYRYKDGAIYCVEVQKDARGSIQFTVSGTASVEIMFSSTGGENTSWVGLLDAEGNIVPNNEGIDSVYGANDGKTVVTYNLSAGTYSVVSPSIIDEETGKNPYSRAARVYYVNVTEIPPQEIQVETTDTYGYADEYSFTAGVEGYYSFNVPAGLGFYSKEKYDAYGNPEIDFYENTDGFTVVIGLEEGETLVFYVGAITKDVWNIVWTCAPGEVDKEDPVTPPAGDATELVVGSNTLVFAEGELSDGKTYPFTVTEEGTYTFAGDLIAVVMDADGNTLGRGQVALVPGTYSVTFFSMMPLPANSFTINISFAGAVTGDPDGSEQYPYVWETLPESVTFVSDNSNMVYYVFTATADGSVTFTWAVEGNDWFNYFELVDGNTTENNASGFAKTSHTFVVEAGKTYRVGLGTWNEGGETVVSIAFTACAHEWSEATCQVLSTCAKCGATTGDYADHIPNSESPTCADPAECTVCGTEVGYIPHEWDEGVTISNPDCSTETNGLKKFTCTVCGATQEEEIWAYHDWVVDEEVYATCTTDGYYKAHCSVCNAIEEYTSEAQGHYNWYATCGETTNCMECGLEFTVEHNGSEATCTEPMYCYNCWQYVGEPLGHTPGDAATCTTAQICTVCEIELAPATGHNYVDGICGGCGVEDPNYYFVVSNAEAVAKADGKKVQVTGVVISAEAWNTQYNNMSVTIKDANGDTLYIFRLATQVGLGDTITVKGVVGSYNDAKQIAAGATAVIDVVHGDNHTYANGVCTVCGSKEPVAGETTVKCDFSTVSGTQYADETKTFGDVTVSTHNKGCHFNTQLRIYDSSSNDGWAIITAGKTVTGFKVNAGYKAATLNVYGSVDGETWTLIQAVTTTTAYTDYTVNVDSAAGYKFIKIDAVGAQIRVPSVEISYQG